MRRHAKAMSGYRRSHTRAHAGVTCQYGDPLRIPSHVAGEPRPAEDVERDLAALKLCRAPLRFGDLAKAERTARLPRWVQ